MKEFECMRCGKCCNRNNMFITIPNITFRKNGDCMYLDSETKLCTIYDERPTICAQYPYYMVLQITNNDLCEFGFGGHKYKIERRLCLNEVNDSSIS